MQSTRQLNRPADSSKLAATPIDHGQFRPASLPQVTIPIVTPMSRLSQPRASATADSLSQLTVVGISHATAAIAIREKLAFPADGLAESLGRLNALSGVEAGCIISTCNRSEIYVSSASDQHQPLLQWLASERGISSEELSRCSYIHRDNDAARHLFRVACGLDSMVLGEPQILGQLKQAYQSTREHSNTQSALNPFFEASFRVAKQVRTETEIGAHPVSVAFSAARLAQQIFADFSQLTALFIGAGETIELACRHLTEAGLERPLIANRTLQRAQALATQFHGAAVSLNDIAQQIPAIDIIVSSTGSPDLVLEYGTVKAALKKRRHRPLFIVDLAVPRDIDPKVDKFDDIYLYTVDDLQHVVREGQRSREQAAKSAEAIIDEEVKQFFKQLRARSATDTIRALRSRAEAERDVLLEQARRTIERDGPEAALELLANRLTNKLLHAPTSVLSQAAANGDTETLDLVRKLFDLPPTSSSNDGNEND